MDDRPGSLLCWPATEEVCLTCACKAGPGTAPGMGIEMTLLTDGLEVTGDDEEDDVWRV